MSTRTDTHTFSQVMTSCAALVFAVANEKQPRVSEQYGSPVQISTFPLPLLELIITSMHALVHTNLALFYCDSLSLGAALRHRGAGDHAALVKARSPH